MRAITQAHTNAPLELSEIPAPKPNPEQLLIRVHATALNRADLLQRCGKYPPPPGESTILGLEIAGEIVKLGANVQGFQIGQRIFGLVGSGGYAEYACIDQGLAMPIPENFSYVQAAAIPEAFLTANEALFTLGNLNSSETILIHAGASGVGSAAIQLAHQTGATVFTTVSSAEKAAQVTALGANNVINYKEQDFSTIIKELTQDKGVNVIIDFIGASYLEKNLASLCDNGRLVCVGLLGGTKAEINLATVLTKRLQIKGLVMRHRSIADKRAITQRFMATQLPLINKGLLQPVIDTVYPLAKAQQAHEHMESNANIGKIILEIK